MIPTNLLYPVQAYTECPPKKTLQRYILNFKSVWVFFLGHPVEFLHFEGMWRHRNLYFAGKWKSWWKRVSFFFPEEICVLSEVIMCEFYLPIKYIQNLLAGSYVLPVWIQNNYKSKTKQWQIQKIFWKLPPLKLSSPTGCPWKSYLIWMIKESLSKIFLG